MIPIRPGFGHLTVVTKNIIILNVLMFVLTLMLQQTQNIDLNKYLGLHYHLAPDFRPHQFITYLFMHGSFRHLFFNMFAIFIFGPPLEQVWGPKRYIIFYIITGLGAALAQYIINHFQITEVLAEVNEVIQNSRNPQQISQLIQDKEFYLNNNIIVGASGSLFGLLGAFGMLFPNQLLNLYFIFPVKAKWFVIGYGVIELAFGITNNPMDNVAHFAHLGGLFVGLIMVLIWRRDRTHFY